MDGIEKHVVTGAFGYSGKYIAMRLLEEGAQVHTLTNSPQRANPFEGKVTASPYYFEDDQKLVTQLEGCQVLYNTYWVRFNHPLFKHASAVQNTLKLFKAAKKAGVGRIIHISITNPSLDSDLEYFRGKAELEAALIQSEIPHTILRPTVLFGKEDILINNIAWVLRRFPVFGVFGDGEYRLQPIYVDDLARLAVEEGKRRENRIIDAIGPETFTFRELVSSTGLIIGKPRQVVSVPPSIGYYFGTFIGWLKGDVFITRDEIKGLMRGLLYTDSPPTGDTRLTDWMKKHASTLGLYYSSELARRIDRKSAYDDLRHIK
jgi:NADH dehydrogenase